MPEMRPATALPPGTRDPRLDFFRGLSLIMIFANHVPGTIYELFTSRNLGHSDAAEGFVFMSGCAAALAYGPKLEAGLSLGAFRKLWGRSWLLYLVHLMVTFVAAAIMAGAARWFGGAELITQHGHQVLASDPAAFVIGVITLGHQLGYVNILPMYAVLLLGAPFLIRLGQRSMRGLLAFTIGFWVLVGTFHFDLPNYPYEGGWFFNPFAWQLLFSLGILTGLALRRGERFVPVSKPLIWIAAIWAAFCFVWVKYPPLKEVMSNGIWQLRQWDVPYLLVDFDKTYVSIPRLSHFLALAYLLSLPGIVPRIAGSRLGNVVRVFGRQSLPVFALGTVLAIFAQAVKVVHPGGFVQDTVLVFGGLALQYALAASREWLRAQDRKAAATLPKHRAPTEPVTPKPSAPIAQAPRRRATR